MHVQCTSELFASSPLAAFHGFLQYAACVAMTVCHCEALQVHTCLDGDEMTNMECTDIAQLHVVLLAVILTAGK